MLELKDINVILKDHYCLKDITLDIQEGEILGIAGPSGCGKSALLSLAAGRVRNFMGIANYMQLPLTSYTGKNLNREISYMDGTMPERLDETVYRFVLHSRAPFKKALAPYSEEDRQCAEYAVRHLGLDGFRNTILEDLPAGTLRAVLLAFSIARNAPLLVLDEPTAYLDINFIMRLGRTVPHIVKDGKKAVILGGSDLNFMFQHCDRICFMKRGEIMKILTPDKITVQIIREYFDAEVLLTKNVYNGRPELHLFPDM